MSLTASFNSLTISTPFLNGSTPLSRLSKPTSFPTVLPIRALKTIQGKVVKSSRDKTVAVEVTRLAPHPKYHRRIRIKKIFHAHDPDNQFQVGDFVQLEKSRPISKTKSFLAIPLPPRGSKQKNQVPGGDGDSGKEELGIPLQSQQGA